MSEHIQISIAKRVQFIRINRQERKNALDLSMYKALTDAIHRAESNRNIRVTVITGVADSFCSGNDIEDFLMGPPADASSPIIRFVETLIGTETPIVAAVNGHAIGIGATMLLHCDLVYAADGARFQMPFVNIGLCPEAGSSFLLPLLMGHRQAAEMLYLGKTLNAVEAARLGLVNAVYPASQLESEAMEAAEGIAAQPPEAVRTTKRLLRDAFLDAVGAASRREMQSFLPLLNGPEAREALSAFMEKRAPDFSRF
jgi:enoyl-CoA hydratase/carnithine racemase